LPGGAQGVAFFAGIGNLLLNVVEYFFVAFALDGLAFYFQLAHFALPFVHLFGYAVELHAHAGGAFVYDNRGMLTPEASTMLDAEIAAADLDDTEPVNWAGSCGAFDSIGTETLWVGEQSISFETSCLIRGIVPLYEIVHTILAEIDTCNPNDHDLLESIEPDCQVVF
jgi:hypothetical protein